MTGEIIDFRRLFINDGNHCTILANEGKVGNDLYVEGVMFLKTSVSELLVERETVSMKASKLTSASPAALLQLIVTQINRITAMLRTRYFIETSNKHYKLSIVYSIIAF